MSRSTQQSTNLLPYSFNPPEGYNDTESEADPIDAGDDPLEYDTDKDKDIQNKHDRRRPLDVETTRRAPNVSPYGQNRENEFSESDPRQGLNPISRRFIDYNVVDIDTTFLPKSADYLKLHRSTLRNQSVPEWRQRARCAVRAGDPALARKLIQQAQLIKLSQDNSDIGDLVRGGDSVDFKWFVKITYTRYLTYLAEAEAEGLLRSKRREMLQPWRTFVQQAWGEDIAITLSRSLDSVSATFLDKGTKPREIRPSLLHQSRNSVSSLPRPQDNRGLQTVTSHRPSAVSISLPFRRSEWRDEEETLTPSHPQAKSDPRGQGVRNERKTKEHQEATTRQRPQAVATQSSTTLKKQKYVNNQPQNSPERYEDALEDLKEIEQPEEDETEEQDDDEEEEDDDDDDDDHDDDDDDDDDGEEEEQEASKRVGSGFVQLRGERAYEYANGRVNPQTSPRILPSAKQTINTRSSQDHGTSKAAPLGRGQSLTPTKSLSPSSTITSTPAPSSASAQGLSDLMKQFIAQQTYQDCRRFCESNPEIFDEDIKPLQNIAAHYLRQNRANFAGQVIERRFMLQDANTSPEDNIDWMRKLAKTKFRQEQLQSKCKMALGFLEDALTAVSAPPVQSPEVVEAQRRGGSDGNRSNVQRSEGRQVGINTKTTKTLRS